MAGESPIAGVDLEAEQVIEEEAEKPVRGRGTKVRPIFVIFGGVLVLEAFVLIMIFGSIGGGNPDQQVASADIDLGPPLDIGESLSDGVLLLGDISLLEPSPTMKGRNTETTLIDLKISIEPDAWKTIGSVQARNPDAERLLVMDIRSHVREFMAEQGGQNLTRSQNRISEELLSYLNSEFRLLSKKITRVDFDRVKSLTR